MADECDCVTCGGENGTTNNGCHLSVYSVDIVIVFACHFVASHHPPLLAIYKNELAINSRSMH